MKRWSSWIAFATLIIGFASWATAKPLGRRGRGNIAGLDPGDKWYCARGDTCSRSRSECTRHAGAPCDAINTAYVTTSADIDGKEGSLAHIYRDLASCVEARRAFDANDYSLSACTRVGPIARAAVDPKIVPPGKGWYCYSREPYGWCWRDRSACEQSHAMETEPTTSCSFVERAFVSQYAGQETDAFPTRATCQAWLDEFPASTRCEPL